MLYEIQRTNLLRNTVPVSSASAIFRNASSDPGLAITFVQIEAVRPYGESFMSSIASSSDETCVRNY